MMVPRWKGACGGVPAVIAVLDGIRKLLGVRRPAGVLAHELLDIDVSAGHSNGLKKVALEDRLESVGICLWWCVVVEKRVREHQTRQGEKNIHAHPCPLGVVGGRCIHPTRPVPKVHGKENDKKDKKKEKVFTLVRGLLGLVGPVGATGLVGVTHGGLLGGGDTSGELTEPVLDGGLLVGQERDGGEKCGPVVVWPAPPTVKMRASATATPTAARRPP